jgi:hypothetical protein
MWPIVRIDRKKLVVRGGHAAAAPNETNTE